MTRRSMIALLALLTPVAVSAQQVRRLSLHDAVALARSSAPSARIAGDRSQAASASVRVARSALMPTLGATATGLNHSMSRASLGLNFPGIPDVIGPFGNQDARLVAKMNLYDPSAWKRLDAARANEVTSRLDTDGAAEAVAFVAANAYISAERSQSRVVARQRELARAQQLEKLANDQLQAGVVSGIDVTRAQVEVAAAKGAVVSAQGDLTRDRLALQRALGLDLGDSLVLVDTLAMTDTPLSGDQASLVSAALTSRPELRAEEARIDAAQRGASAIRAEHLPMLAMSADYGFNGHQLDGTAVRTQTLAIGLSWSAWDGGRNSSRMDQQQAVILEAQERSRDARLMIDAEVRTSLNALNTAREMLGVAGERRDLAEKELTQSEERYKAGYTGNLDVISAQGGVNRAADAWIDALYAFSSARLATLRALGRMDTL